MAAKALPDQTRISSKGQVVLPAAIRARRQWTAGTALTVEETPDGVLLRAAPFFPPTTIEQVFGMLKYDGPPVTLEDMDEAITAEVMARHARGRY